MAQLQDGERMAMTMMSDVIQSAGYFPAPIAANGTTLIGSLPAVGAFATGQTITGTSNFNAEGDQISIRYQTANNDNILNCSGTSNTTGANQPYVNTFEILPDANGNLQLVCIMNGTQYTLVSGVTQLTVLYGVKANAAATGNSVDTYMTATQVTGDPSGPLWSNVVSVQVALTFTNPMYAANPNQPPTFQVQRVIGVMNQSGPMQ
jgi:type IV pilus assembly protein PilW